MNQPCEVKRLVRQRDALKEELETALGSSQSLIEELEREMECWKIHLKMEINQLVDEKVALQDENASLGDAVRRMAQQISELEAEKQDFKEETRSLRQDVDKLRSESILRQILLTDLKKELSTSEEEKKVLETRLRKMDGQILELEEVKESLKDETRTLHQDVEKLQSESKSYQNRLRDLKKRNASLSEIVFARSPCQFEEERWHFQADSGEWVPFTVPLVHFGTFWVEFLFQVFNNS